MTDGVVIGEDALCCAVGERLAVDVLGWRLTIPTINCQGATRLRANLPRYVQLAKSQPVLCIADTDGQCAVARRLEWLRTEPPMTLLFRLAVTECESWLLADREGIAKFFEISERRVPQYPDQVSDPKTAMVNLARSSKVRLLRQEMVAPDGLPRPGSGYNAHLLNFVHRHWRIEAASDASPSLARTVRRLRAVAAGS